MMRGGLVLLCSLWLWSGAGAWAQGERKPVRWVNPEVPSARGLTHRVMDSASLGHEVGYVVWLPPGYAEDEGRRYPVIYFLHGMGGNESADAGGFSSLIAGAIAKGKMAPVICVFPNGGRSGYRDGVETMITEELLPTIDTTYRTLAGPRGRGLAGFSMGGGGAVWLSLRHPELFGFAGSWGGGLWRVEDEAVALAEKHGRDMGANGFAALLINGDGDRPDAFGRLVPVFKAAGVEHRVVVLEDTKHNLGPYYERGGAAMTEFLGKRLRGVSEAGGEGKY